MKRKAEEDATKPVERRPFDRDMDLQVNRFDEAQKKALLKKSQELNTRFSYSKDRMFLWRGLQGFFQETLHFYGILENDPNILSLLTVKMCKVVASSWTSFLLTGIYLVIQLCHFVFFCPVHFFICTLVLANLSCLGHISQSKNIWGYSLLGENKACVMHIVTLFLYVGWKHILQKLFSFV